MNDLQYGIAAILVSATISGLLFTWYVALFDYCKKSDIPMAFAIGFFGVIFFALGIAAIWILAVGLWVALG